MDNLIKDIDLNLARKISLSEAKRLSILPIKAMEDTRQNRIKAVYPLCLPL